MNAWLPPRTPVRADQGARRRSIRYLAAAASAATAVLYFGIGIGVLKVVDEASPAAPDMFAFGAPAGTAFVVGAILLLAFDRRILWVLGAVLQVGVIVMYVAIAQQRTPPFEVWGILIKVLQAAILAALVYLVVRPSTRAVGATRTD
jgi:hypothetical protein